MLIPLCLPKLWCTRKKEMWIENEKKNLLKQPDHSLAINADAGRGRDFEDLRRKVASVGRVCMPTSAVRLRLLSWVRKSPSFYFLERQLLCRGAIMAEVPAEAPAEGEAVAEVKIDFKLSSLRLTFPRKILCQHHAWTSQNSLQRYVHSSRICNWFSFH